MKRAEAIEGARLIREALNGVGGTDWAISWSLVRGTWMIEVAFGGFGVPEVRKVRVDCPVDDAIIRLVRETAEDVAGSRFVDGLAPWIRAAVDDLIQTCPPSRARELALTVLGDMEADRIPAPIVNGLASGISLIWDFDDSVMELWFPIDQFCYHVIARIGDSPQSACVVAPFICEVGGKCAIGTHPEYVRGVLEAIFCNHPCGGSNWDADDVLREFGFTEAEISAIEETEK